LKNARNKREKARYRSTRRELVSEALVLIIAAAVIFVTGRNTKIMSVAVAIIVAGRFALLYRKGDVLFFILGVVLGGGNDLMSMYKGVYHYTPPTILPVPIPVWMIFFWGLVFVFFRKLMRFGPFVGEDTPHHRAIDLPLAVDLVIVLVYRAIIYRFYAEPWLPGALFASILAVRLLLLPPASNERRLMLAVLLLGPLYEIILIKAGLYVYQHGVIFGMPLWLVVYWVFIVRVLKAITDRLENPIAQLDIP